jgi:hypothetical protein
MPRAVLGLSVALAAALLVPLLIANSVGGSAAATYVFLGYISAFGPALLVPRRVGLILTIPSALTGVVASHVNGHWFAATCFVALACLAIAPANMAANGLMAGLPTVAAVLAGNPFMVDPRQLAAWMLFGGVVVVLLIGRLRSPDAQVVKLDPWTAWVHAGAMAGSVALVVGFLNLVTVPHGYWISATLTVILRPARWETESASRDRVIGTIAGASIALLFAAFVPEAIDFTMTLVLMVLVVANGLMGRPAQQVLYQTPVIVLLGSNGGVGALIAAFDRIMATLVGAVLAGGVALWIAKMTRKRAVAEELLAQQTPE